MKSNHSLLRLRLHPAPRISSTGQGDVELTPSCAHMLKPSRVCRIASSQVWQTLDGIAAKLSSAGQAHVSSSAQPPKNQEGLTDTGAARVLSLELRPPQGRTRRSSSSVVSGAKEVAFVRRVNDRITQLRREGAHISTASYNAVLSIYSRAHLHSEAKKVFHRMKSESVPLDATSFNTLLHSSAKSRSTSQFNALWGEMLGCGVAPTSHTYTALFLLMAGNKTEAGKHRFPEEAPFMGGSLENIGVVLKEARRGGHLNLHAMNAAVGACRTAEDAEKLFRYMTDKTDLEMDRFTLLGLLSKCGSDTARAGRFFTEAKRRDLVLTVKEWTALLNVYKESGNVVKMKKVWDALSAEVEPSSQSYAVFVKGCVASKAVADAEAKYHEALKSQKGREAHLHTNMMQVYASVLDAAGADQVLKNAKGFGITPGPLLTAYKQARGG
eukprot:TRINITY_DN32662_c0_g1_i2.p1 TRINITY_DN32662_c0_g1~~TRINITY_DN32662_c0_g1_i2.p1  ORF type:complete len:487 (+),score=42.62 TRINITY_DN32662_c0_g1_i2:143-1462(+)